VNDLLKYALIVGGSVFALTRIVRRRPPTPPGRPEVDPDLHRGEIEPPPPGVEYDPRPPCGTVEQLEVNPAEPEACLAPWDVEPQQITPLPFAEGDPEVWPVLTGHPWGKYVSYWDVKGKFHGRWGRSFASKRTSDGVVRHHSGIDIAANPGDIVVATEPGTILATLPYYKGTDAIYERTDSGLVINYGEIAPDSWTEFGISDGDRVEAGQPIARVGWHDMLHLETYEAMENPEQQVQRIRNREYVWIKEDGPPEGLLDPSSYLVKAARAEAAAVIGTS